MELIEYLHVDMRLSEYAAIRPDGTEERDNRFNLWLSSKGEMGWVLVCCPDEYRFIFMRDMPSVLQ